MTNAALSKDRLTRLHDILADHVERAAAPGLVSVVSRRGETHVDVIGTTALDGARAMGDDTIFRISSMTKPVTAVATLLLVEECVLRLDDPVDALLPEPGERWLYHTGADVLGVLIARACGQPFETVLQKRVFEPLGMRDTALSVPPVDLDRFATSYTTDQETGALEVYDEPGGQWSTPPAFPSGGAGLVSTAGDFLAFAEMLLRGGAPILSRPSVETMTTDHLTPAQKQIGGFFPGDFAALGWGFGVGIVTRRDDPAAPVGQYGWDGGLGTIWRNDPSEQMITVLLTNAAWTSPRPPAIAADFFTGAYAALAD